MTGFAPAFLDRLYGEPAAQGAQRLTAEQLKDSVARDLEALLNTRLALPPQVFDGCPLARDSVLDYGLADFAGMCLASSEDREAICASIKRAVETHEPRLTDVTASFVPGAGSVNRLNIVITARLAGHPSGEPVNFNAVFQPSSLRYAIISTHRGARTG